MSSSSPSRPDRRAAAAAFVLAMVVVQGFGALPAAAAIPLPVVAVLPGAERTSLVVDLGAGTGPVTDQAVQVTVGGAAQQATLTPVISDRLAVTLIVDASETGGATLPAWLSAAARFILEVPSETMAAAVADTSPPIVLAPAKRGPTSVVRALSAVRAAGQRRTSSALTLATQQFTAAVTGPRVVVFYTSSADAGGETAGALAARLRREATILVVVGTADSTYWADATRGTGGFFAPAGTPVVVPALDQVETTLRGRYLVQFPTPKALPARASVQIDTGSLTLTADTVIPAEDDALPRSDQSGIAIDAVWWVLAGCLTILAATTFFLTRRYRRLPANRPVPPAPPAPAVTIARGRAAVPPSVARGRSPVPDSPPEEPPSATT